MPYWVPSEVAAFFPVPQGGEPLVTASSYPVDLPQVATYIYLVSGQLDAAAAAVGYGVPIPSTIAGYGYVLDVIRWGVTAEVLEQLYVGPDNEGLRFRQMFERAIEAIRSGQQPIAGAPFDSGAIAPMWAKNSEPIFKRGQSNEYADTTRQVD